jgi:phytol kinase
MAEKEAVPEGIPRKVLHVGIFAGAVPAQLLLGFWGVVTYGVVISIIVLAGFFQGPGLPFHRALARPEKGRDSHHSVLTPLVSTALGGLAAVLLVGHFAAVGYLACGLGDAAGEPVGRRWGRHRYRSFPWNKNAHRRSVEGSLAVFGAGSFGAAIALGLIDFSFPQALIVGFACGAAGAIGEGLSGRGTDNFWVQILASLTAWGLLG